MPRRPKRPTLRTPEAIGGVIDRAGRAGATGPFASKPNIPLHDWEAAVGARIAERARPIELDRGTLIVRVATSVWASELSLLAMPILERLRARGLDVRALRYRVGAIEAEVRPLAVRPTRAVPAPLPLPDALERDLGAVNDDDLRAVIGDAARANLAWQAYVGPETASGGDLTGRATPAGLRGARVPRSSETESAPPARTSAGARGGARRTP